MNANEENGVKRENTKKTPKAIIYIGVFSFLFIIPITLVTRTIAGKLHIVHLQTFNPGITQIGHTGTNNWKIIAP